MSDYLPPLEDIRFLLEHVIGLEQLPEHPDLGKLDIEMLDSVFEPAAKLASEVLAPINKSGDEEGAILKDGKVTTAKGFKEAYNEYREGGWNAVPFPSEYGGQALPWTVAFPIQEMWQSANMSFGLCPLLNQGAIDAIEAHGSEEQKEKYLEKLISGEWTGTMNLTEPQAGSDLSVIRTKAEPQDDGSYKIFGQKIYITYGEHDLAENIIHLVLARLPDAPEGVKGISLFIVPKILDDGTTNDVICTGIEHKLGIHASPTCTMQFGDKGGATGYLVGESNEGLKYMFTMMNNARLSVGLQGVAIAERSYQHALAYAKEREQGTALMDKSKRVSIIEHADVKRMLLMMKSQIEAMRALTYEAALCLDLGRNGDAVAQAKVDLLTPIVKAYATDMAVEVTSIGVQIHGGMGFVEETGAAQYYRDARILPIYEGTNGIQALDLIFRKIVRDKGAALESFLQEIAQTITELSQTSDKDLLLIHHALDKALNDFQKVVPWLTKNAQENPEALSAIPVPLLHSLAIIAGGNMMARSAIAADAKQELNQGNAAFIDDKINTCVFYCTNILPKCQGYSHSVREGSNSILNAQF
ncbi:MAG: acyl-CoA dehydrogenase [Pseudomonadota bacterium]